MATKKQVMALAKAQGAVFECDRDNGVLDVYVALPDGFIWDNGYNSGSVAQEKYEGETMAEFWDGIMFMIDAPVKKVK